MKRWLPWFALPVMACVGILLNRASAPNLLADTDTAVLLRALQERNNPLSWFWTDWPLQNHFYRPVSTLFFEFDNLVHHGDPAGYGLTNALLAAVCVLLVFWLVRELSEKPWMAGLSAALFGIWHISPGALSLLDPACWALATLAFLGLFGGVRKKFLVVLLSALTLAYLSSQWQPVTPFHDRVVGWLPGRTASTMTLFALVAMAAYCRFERLSAGRFPSPLATPLDLPATKGTEVAELGATSKAWLWCALAVLGLTLALGCYEQAVMLPAVLVGCAVVFRANGRRPHWWVHAVFWGVLLVYVVVRSRFVPTAPSGYQEQQFRNGPGVFIGLMDYVFPGWNWGRALVTMLGSGLVLLVTTGPWVMSIYLAGNALSWKAVWSDPLRWQVLGWFAVSCLAFLPMAWLQPFGHYHYWPSALRAVFVVGFASVAVRTLAIAVARPAVQAPQRPRPAPGSLPRL